MCSRTYDLKERASSYIATLKVNRYLLPTFGETKVINFRTAQLETYIKQRQREVSAATINREISLLRRAFKLGFQADPPMVARVPHFPKLEEHNVRTGYLKPQQYRKLLTEVPEERRLLFVFGYHVGVRKGALLRIKWEQVDTAAGLVYMEKKRSGKHVGRVLPIYGDMAAFIAMQPRESEYLFARGSEPIKDFRGSWKAACKRAGVPGLLFHDLRRTAVRNMRRSGVPESLIMKITGHKTRAVFERYNIIDEDDIREAGRKTENFLSSEESSQIDAQTKTERKERFS